MNNVFTTIRMNSTWLTRLLAGVFALMSVLPVPLAVATDMPPVVLDLPEPGTRIAQTATYQPVQLRGLTINAEEPLQFDFIIDPGDHDLDEQAARAESAKLIRYFLAALAVPEDQLWVNLSPYERDRIIPGALGETAMGRDMLAQDYLLKQLTASMIYPEDDLGTRFWDRVHRRAQAEFGTTDIPMNTFNKVWIVPQEATVHVNGQSVFVVDCDLKVMLEEDYLALEQHTAEQSGKPGEMNGVTAAVVRDVLLPEIEREVNEGETFANLRQIFHAVILATWYKQNLKESLLGQAYAGRNVVEGIDENDPRVNAEIYQQYVAAMKKGVFDYIREDVDPLTRQTMPRRYVSGGVDARVQVRTDQSMLSRRDFLKGLGGLFIVTAAMVTGQPVFGEDKPEPPRLVAPGVQDRGQELRWSDRTPMLGESQPGIAYYHSPTNSYTGLLDTSEGGQGEAARIHAAGFRVVKVYTTTQANMLELEKVSKRIYEQYGLRTLAIFSPQINGALISRDAGALWDAVNFYVKHLGQHPWIGIQIGNEDHYYLRGDLLAGDNGIPLTHKQYYGRYDQIAGEMRKQLRLTAPFAEAKKPILLGQGIRIAHRDNWREKLDEVIGFVRGMKNINGLAVNAYLEPAQLYGPALQYLRQQTGLSIVVGEFGRSRRHLTPALQHSFNQQAWATIRESMRSGHAAGGILFSWSDKVPGDEATGATPNFRLHDREFGINYERGTGPATYYDQSVSQPGLIARENYAVNDNLFWQAVHNPRVNREYLVWYTQQLQGRAAEQQRQKVTSIQRLTEQGRLMTDNDVNHYHALNFMGEALYQLAIQALYDGNVAELERLYDQMYVYYSGAQMHYGPRSFWVPFRNLTAQMELIRDTTTDEQLKEKLRLIIAARPTKDRPATYQDIRPDNSMLAQITDAPSRYRNVAELLDIETTLPPRRTLNVNRRRLMGMLGIGGAGTVFGLGSDRAIADEREGDAIQPKKMSPDVRSLFLVGMHHKGPLADGDNKFQEKIVRLAAQGKVVVAIEGLERDAEEERKLIKAIYGVDNTELIFGMEHDFSSAYTGVLLKYGYIATRMQEQIPVAKTQLIYDLLNSPTLAKAWETLANKPLTKEGEFVYDGINLFIDGTRGWEIGKMVNVFHQNLHLFGTDAEWIEIYRNLAEILSVKAATYEGAHKLDMDKIEMYLAEPAGAGQEYVVFEVNNKWRNGFILENISRLRELAKEKDLDLFVLIGEGHISDMSKNIGSGVDGYVKRVYRRTFSIAPELIPDLDDKSMLAERNDSIVVTEEADGALLNTENPGGIDFNPAHMDLRTQGHGIQFRVPATLEDIRIESLRPVIINVTPVMSLPLLLGLEEPDPAGPRDTPHKSYQLSLALPAERQSRR